MKHSWSNHLIIWITGEPFKPETNQWRVNALLILLFQLIHSSVFVTLIHCRTLLTIFCALLVWVRVKCAENPILFSGHRQRCKNRVWRAGRHPCCECKLVTGIRQRPLKHCVEHGSTPAKQGRLRCLSSLPDWKMDQSEEAEMTTTVRSNLISQERVTPAEKHQVGNRKAWTFHLSLLFSVCLSRWPQSKYNQKGATATLGLPGKQHMEHLWL